MRTAVEGSPPRSYTRGPSGRPATSSDPHERLIDALSRIVRQRNARADRADVLETILAEGVALLDAEGATLFLDDPEGGGRRVSLVVGAVEGVSRLSTPLIRQGHVGGSMEVVRAAPFRDLDLRVLEVLAEQAAAHIEYTRLLRDKLAAERRAALGNVASGLAHYLSNVLGQWKGSATLIDVGLDRRDLGVIADAWRLLGRAHERIATLVQDMLELSKPRHPERTPVDLGELARQVAQAEADRARRLGVSLVVDASPDTAVAMLDRDALYEVITNLVANALDALEENGSAGSVRIVVRSEANVLVLEVSDDGPGIPAHVRGRIFDPFFSTKGSRGTGLGLSLVAKAVEEHGGTIRLVPREGPGATFEVRLPAA